VYPAGKQRVQSIEKAGVPGRFGPRITRAKNLVHCSELQFGIAEQIDAEVAAGGLE
jgi:hypothetical protein